MSESDSSDADAMDDVVRFTCKRCPGKIFTDDDKDSHRQWHRDQKKNNNQGKRSPRRKTRGPSPAPTTISLFSVAQVDTNGHGRPGPKSKTRSGNDRMADAAKRYKNTSKRARAVRVDGG